VSLSENKNNPEVGTMVKKRGLNRGLEALLQGAG